MQVRILQAVEDGNEFTAADLDGHPVALPYTVAKPVAIKVGDTIVGCYRVDKFPAGVVVDLPTKQAESLIALRLAELA